MHKIYFDRRCLSICTPDDQALEDPNVVRCHVTGQKDIDSLAEMFKSGEGPGRVFVASDDEEGAYRDFCASFRNVNAAGGLVANKRGDFLLIRRNGLWDLPKGHQEAGEDIRITAMREVQEETGISELVLGDLICITDHCYLRDGIWHLKHTWWYEMLYDNPLDLTPQKDEDISKAAWVAKSSLPSFLDETYPSIAEVFREIRNETFWRE